MTRFPPMNDNEMRVRFAPSPTGHLHLGGARTALFNWLLARRHGGAFILRIEDTDRERSSAAMTQAILDDLSWLGLDWDEGPYRQADGVSRHRREADRLIVEGCGYRCFCTPEQLAKRREETGGGPEASGYDRFCRERYSAAEAAQRAADGEPHVIRFRVPAGDTTWDDAVCGGISFANSDIEDFVVLRSDKTPVYNLAVVSDDASMRISHVVRGDDHISNTPKQILLYQALGHALPTFAHVPMIIGPDGRRLSKRHGADAVADVGRQGILPWALLNYLALLGWNPGTDEEFFETEELIQRFSLGHINRKSSVFDWEKLRWLNGQHITRSTPQRLEPLVSKELEDQGLVDADFLHGRREWFLGLIDLLKPRARGLQDFAVHARPFLVEEVEYEDQAVAKHWRDPVAVRGRLLALRERLAEVPQWAEEDLEVALRGLAAQLEIGAGKLIHPLRVAVTGTAASPGIFQVLVCIGKEKTLNRMDTAIQYLEATGCSSS